MRTGDWDTWSPIVARYLGEITLLDRQVGRILDALDALGLADTTLVIFSADHGDLCGGHGLIDKHYVMYDDLVRVPLILRWPAGLPRGHSDAFVSAAIDIAATITTAAEIEPPATFAGVDLRTRTANSEPAGYLCRLLRQSDGTLYAAHGA